MKMVKQPTRIPPHVRTGRVRHLPLTTSLFAAPCAQQRDWSPVDVAVIASITVAISLVHGLGRCTGRMQKPTSLPARSPRLVNDSAVITIKACPAKQQRRQSRASWPMGKLACACSSASAARRFTFSTRKVWSSPGTVRPENVRASRRQYTPMYAYLRMIGMVVNQVSVG